MEAISIGAIANSLIGTALYEGLKAAGKAAAGTPREEVIAGPVGEVVRALESEFRRERSPGAAGLVLRALQETAQDHPLTPEFLAEHGFDIDEVCEAMPAPKRDPSDPQYDRAAALYQRALRIMVTRAVMDCPRPDGWGRRQETNRAYAEFEERYRAWVANDTSRIRLLGIRTPEVVDFDLETAWVDLGVGALRQTAGPGELSEEEPDIASLDDMRKRLSSLWREASGFVGQAVDEVLGTHRRLVIVGAPGSGKTTLMRYLAHLAAKGQLRKVGARLEEDLLPFLILVRALDFGALPEPEELVAHLSPKLQGAYPESFVTDRLANGRALVLVDGLDECEKVNHEKVLVWLRDLTNAFPTCRYLLTSRPAGYQAGELRGCHYAEVGLQALGAEQLRAFVERWYRAAEEVTTGPEAEAIAERGAADLLRRITSTPSVRPMAANPLLLSVLCVVHRYRHEALPERRAQLLDECVDVLLHQWREAQTGLAPVLVGDLDASRKGALVRPLAWWMMEEGIAEARRPDVERIFRATLPAIDQQPDRAPELLDHIRDCSGLLVEQRPGVFAFAHLIFQEYLAAEHADDEGLWDALLEQAGDPQWQQVIPLAAGLSGRAAKTLVRALKDAGHLHLAGHCVAGSVSLPAALRDEVTEALVHLGADLWTQATLRWIGGQGVARSCLRALRGIAPNAAAAGTAHAKLRAFSRGSGYPPGLPRPAFSGDPLGLADAAMQKALEYSESPTHRSALEDAHAIGMALGSDVADIAGGHISWGVVTGVQGMAIWDSRESTVRAAHLTPLETEALDTGGRAAGLSSVLGRIGVADLLGDAQDAILSSVCPEAQLYLWNAVAEELGVAGFDWAVNQLDSLQRDVYPLLRLCVIHRLRHRWEAQLTEAQQAHLQDLITKAQEDLKAHFVRFNEMVEEEIERRLADDRGEGMAAGDRDDNG